jgi:hypothetical protein
VSHWRRREIDLAQLHVKSQEAGALPEQLGSGNHHQLGVVRLARQRQRDIRADTGGLAGGDCYAWNHAVSPT